MRYTDQAEREERGLEHTFVGKDNPSTVSVTRASKWLIKGSFQASHSCSPSLGSPEAMCGTVGREYVHHSGTVCLHDSSLTGPRHCTHLVEESDVLTVLGSSGFGLLREFWLFLVERQTKPNTPDGVAMFPPCAVRCGDSRARATPSVHRSTLCVTNFELCWA